MCAYSFFSCQVDLEIKHQLFYSICGGECEDRRSMIGWRRKWKICGGQVGLSISVPMSISKSADQFLNSTYSHSLDFLQQFNRNLPCLTVFFSRGISQQGLDIFGAERRTKTIANSNLSNLPSTYDSPQRLRYTAEFPHRVFGAL